MISRQAHAHYDRDLDRLRDRLRDTPVLVSLDEARRLFVLTWQHDPTGQPLMKGRYQVVHAYVAGFVQGCTFTAAQSRPVAVADEPGVFIASSSSFARFVVDSTFRKGGQS